MEWTPLAAALVALVTALWISTSEGRLRRADEKARILGQAAAHISVFRLFCIEKQQNEKRLSNRSNLSVSIPHLFMSEADRSAESAGLVQHAHELRRQGADLQLRQAEIEFHLGLLARMAVVEAFNMALHGARHSFFEGDRGDIEYYDAKARFLRLAAGEVGEARRGWLFGPIGRVFSELLRQLRHMAEENRERVRRQ